MDHKEFLRSLPNEQQRSLQKKSNFRGLVHLAGHWGAILLVGYMIGVQVPFWPALMLVQGVLIIMTFTLLHECTHNTPFASAWLNKWVGRTCGMAIGLPFEWFRFFHFAHHKFTNDPANDPELAEGAKPDSWHHYLLYLSGIPVWFSQVKTLYNNAFGAPLEDFVPASAYVRIRTESRTMIVIYAILALVTIYVSNLLIYIWIIPVILGQPFLRLYLLAEHARCPQVFDMFENTRTTFTGNLVRFFTWNMPYHVEHHTMPVVPFHQLPTLHKLIAEHLKITENGYLRFHQNYVDGLGLTKNSE